MTQKPKAIVSRPEAFRPELFDSFSKSMPSSGETLTAEHIRACIETTSPSPALQNYYFSCGICGQVISGSSALGHLDIEHSDWRDHASKKEADRG